MVELEEVGEGACQEWVEEEEPYRAWLQGAEGELMSEVAVEVQGEEHQQTADGDGQPATTDSARPGVSLLQNRGVRLWRPF